MPKNRDPWDMDQPETPKPYPAMPDPHDDGVSPRTGTENGGRVDIGPSDTAKPTGRKNG
jgi:hypothetical protein